MCVVKIFVSIKAVSHFSFLFFVYIGSSTQAPSSSHSNFSEAESAATGYDSKSNVSSWSSRGRAKPRSNTDPPSRIVSLRSGAVGKTSSVTWDRTDVR